MSLSVVSANEMAKLAWGWGRGENSAGSISLGELCSCFLILLAAPHHVPLCLCAFVHKVQSVSASQHSSPFPLKTTEPVLYFSRFQPSQSFFQQCPLNLLFAIHSIYPSIHQSIHPSIPQFTLPPPNQLSICASLLPSFWLFLPWHPLYLPSPPSHRLADLQPLAVPSAGMQTPYRPHSVEH